jgi:hypothetical protein
MGATDGQYVGHLPCRLGRRRVARPVELAAQQVAPQQLRARRHPQARPRGGCRARLTTADDVVYTVWTLPGEERSLDVVLAQSKGSAAEEDLADEVPGLVSLGGCDD